jgi:hypothetical protein
MLTAILVAAQIATVVPADTAPAPSQRVQAIEVSEWYGRRLALHRALSYTVIPLFAFQYAAGNQMWEKGTDAAPAWARRGHRIGAATIGGVFAVNTVTGVWNLWDSRHTEEGRARRYLHAASMLIADAGFTWAGAVLSEQAERDPDKRRLHRTVALTSIGISVTSGLIMYFTND